MRLRGKVAVKKFKFLTYAYARGMGSINLGGFGAGQGDIFDRKREGERQARGFYSARGSLLIKARLSAPRSR